MTVDPNSLGLLARKSDIQLQSVVMKCLVFSFMGEIVLKAVLNSTDSLLM